MTTRNYTLDPDRPLWIKRSETSEDWEKFASAAEFDGDLTFEGLQENFIALVNATYRGVEGILLIITFRVDGATRPQSVWILWDWRQYHSTVNLIRDGVPGTDYDDWIAWFGDHEYDSDSAVVSETITRLQGRIDEARSNAGIDERESR